MKWRPVGPWRMTSCRSRPFAGLAASVPLLPIKSAEPGSPEEGVHGLHTASHALQGGARVHKCAFVRLTVWATHASVALWRPGMAHNNAARLVA